MKTMKKSRFFVSLFALSFLLVGCNDEKASDGNSTSSEVKSETSVSPSNVSKNDEQTTANISAMVETFEFKDAVKIADMIAEVTIVKKIEEIDEPSPKTIFEATVNDKMKNSSSPDTIRIMQQGTESISFNENKLFEPGEKYVLFLQKATDVEDEDLYWIQGEETGMYQLIDEQHLAKLSKSDNALKAFEKRDLSDKLSKQEKEKKSSPKSVQVVNKAQFKQLVKKEVNNP